ncbi:MAG TPA: hypothetical protein VFE56_10115, partial [Candidatus Binataceae bacterium]|nr:hypothetical protein [Candidatus Binataceae bacterium]
MILMVSLPVYGGVIVDASSATSILLLHDESLAFQILTGNFGFNAAHLGLDSYPTDVSFSFATAPMAAPASVSAWLESPNGSLSVVFAGPRDFTSGLWSS